MNESKLIPLPNALLTLYLYLLPWDHVVGQVSVSTPSSFCCLLMGTVPALVEVVCGMVDLRVLPKLHQLGSLYICIVQCCQLGSTTVAVVPQ